MISSVFTALIGMTGSGIYGSNNQLKKEDNPDVRFGAKVDWSEHLDSITSVDDSHGCATQFLEDNKGQIIDVHQGLNNVLQHLSTSFKQLRVLENLYVTVAMGNRSIFACMRLILT